MPLLKPLNDADCLEKLHESVREFMDSERGRTLASQFVDVSDVVHFIRSLTQRDDLGDPDDGPRLACAVTQRLRLPALDPNCFERLALFLALALLLRPDLELTSATLMLDEGLHSFPVEIRDGVPRAVVLDPMTAGLGNAMNATAYQLRNASPMSKDAIGPWFADLARHACASRDALDCYETAMDGIRTSLLTGQPIRNADAIDCVLSMAYQDAQLFGARGRAAHERVCRSLRNLSVALDSKRVAKFLNNLMDVAEPMATNAIKTALIAKFGPAAAIALQGMDLGVVQGTPQLAEQNADQASEKRALIALAKAQAMAQVHADNDDNGDNDPNDDDDHPLTREQKRARMRRMTLAFRPPTHKEN